MKKNNKAFSLVVAIWLVLITSLLAYTILEYIIPFWRNISWVENSTKAYYLANSWIEKWLYWFSTRTDLTEESSINNVSNNYWFSFNTTSSWTVIPPVWRWNSSYDNDWNKISTWDPIQLSIWNWAFNSTTISNLSIFFRVPEVQISIRPSMDSSTNFINWQLTSDSSVLNSNSWSLFNWSNINWSNIDLSNIDLSELEWVLLNWFPQNFNTFYDLNCTLINDKCILKFSVINDLVWTHSSFTYNLPFVEWKVTSWSNNIPLRYSIIDSEWESMWFLKSLNVRVPQETVSEAFDFTVFQ